MRYALTNSTRSATGLHRDDPLPVHVECETRLEWVSDDLWRCPQCTKRGRLVLDPLTMSPSRPTIADEMRLRWSEVPIPAPVREPPEDPTEWQEYFDKCFPDGVLLMRAHDDAQHTVHEDTYVTLATRVHVADEWLDHADLVVTDIFIDRPRYLNKVIRIKQVSPGVLALSNAQGQWVRLDGHLREEEKRTVAARREGGYFGLKEATIPNDMASGEGDG